jgi:hypothetical protein
VVLHEDVEQLAIAEPRSVLQKRHSPQMLNDVIHESRRRLWTLGTKTLFSPSMILLAAVGRFDSLFQNISWPTRTAR